MYEPASSKLFRPTLRWLLTATCLLTGCIHLEQTIHLRRNGSATVQYRYSVAEDTVETLAEGRRAITGRQQGTAASSRGGLEWFTDESAVRNHFSGPGLEVRRYRSYRRDGRLHVELEVFAADAVRAVNDGRFGGWLMNRGADGTITLRSSLPASQPLDGMPAETVDRVQALCEDLWLRLTVIAPADITETTGELAGSRRAVWTIAPGEDRGAVVQSPVIAVAFPGEELDWVFPAAGASYPASQP